jgi:hypothetical protein
MTGKLAESFLQAFRHPKQYPQPGVAGVVIQQLDMGCFFKRGNFRPDPFQSPFIKPLHRIYPVVRKNLQGPAPLVDRSAGGLFPFGNHISMGKKA